MAIQTTYGDELASAVAGMRATSIPATIVSRTVETAAVGFGKAVEQGTADKGCKAFDGGTVFGITVLDRSASGLTVSAGLITGETADSYGVGESAAVLLKGDVWAVCATGCAAGDPVYVRPSNGNFQNTNTDSAVQIAGARWDTTAAAAGLAIINLG